MGSRFLFTKKVKTLGFNLQLKHKGIWLANADATKITKAVARSKAMLSLAITRCGGYADKDAKRFAATYFLTGPEPSTGEWAKISSILQLTYQGIGRDVTLKLGAGSGTLGYVRHSITDDPSESIGVDSDGDMIREKGTIHISKKKLLGSAELLAITFIHEATHKYANTFDHGDSGYREEDDSDWWAPGLTKDQALNNADSYGYFAYRVGEAYGL
ncbi:MAG: hypothetical protein KF889_04130 [Alphaproteobacteria bacterium]|nr:hypothetical protein [Alphaproteobacteria bacterium]MCW5742053.1 hypothetical protein [Alphaproteobacteria bacterium]